METDPSVSPQKLNVTPKEKYFIMRGCDFLALWWLFFITSIIHNSLIREDNIGTWVFTLQFVCLCNNIWNNIVFPFCCSVQSSVGHNVFLCCDLTYEERWGWAVCSCVFQFKRAHLKLCNQSLFQVWFLKSTWAFQWKKQHVLTLQNCPNSNTWIRDLTFPLVLLALCANMEHKSPAWGK